MKLFKKMAACHFIWTLLLSSFSAHAAESCNSLILGLKQGQPFTARVIGALRDRIRPQTFRSEKTINKKAFLEIRDIADKIIQQFPPNEYAYVGVGRSPSAIMAFLKALGLDQIYNVPLTGARGINQLSDDDRKLLYEHFDFFLPSEKKTSQKKIVLIDYVQSGKSMLKTLEVISAYYRDRNSNHSVTIFSIIEPIYEPPVYDPDEDYEPNESYNPSALRPRDEIFEYPHVQLERTALADLFKTQELDKYGEFGSYRVGGHANGSTVNLASSESYLSLVREFKIRILRDLAK